MREDNAVRMRQRQERQNTAIALFHNKYSINSIADKMGLEAITINTYLVDIRKSNKPTKLKTMRKDQSHMQKGNAKVNKSDRIFKTLKRNPSDYRSVSMFDSKNTIKQIKKDDPRSDEEIRLQWKSEQEHKLKNLKD